MKQSQTPHSPQKSTLNLQMYDGSYTFRIRKVTPQSVKRSFSKRLENPIFETRCPQSPWSKTQCFQPGQLWISRVRADLRHRPFRRDWDMLTFSCTAAGESVLVCFYLLTRCLGQCSGQEDGLHEKQAEEPTFTTSWCKLSCFPLKYCDTVLKGSTLQSPCSSFWMHRNKHSCDVGLQRYRANPHRCQEGDWRKE